MSNLLMILQMVIAAVLIAAILLQSRGTGLGNIFGGAGGESYRSKKGAEKILFTATIGLAIGFVLISVINVFVR